ncbi:MAG: DUF2760 domain-containing protein [Deltaproteobacteria bacterium]|nr:DUF2760 domain-containing protein [Deltaproteobacteria bacterium]
MRAIFVVVVYIVAHLVLSQGLVPAFVTENVQQYLLFVQCGLLAYLAAEVVLLVKQAELNKKAHTERDARHTAEQREAGEARTKFEERMGLLEEERDVIREKLAAATLDQNRADQSRDSLKTALHDARQQLEEIKKAQARSQTAEQARAEVLNMLALLQEKGRLLDFVLDDITAYDDQQVGAAARVVHEGCAAVLNDYFEIVPVHQSPEGEGVTVEKDFNAAEIRLVGSVGGSPPYRGAVLHRGWKTMKITLPRAVDADRQQGDLQVITPAEIEIR